MKKVELIKQYEDELRELKTKMLNSQKFAKKLPIFKSIIIDNKMQSDANHLELSPRYKNIYLAWGINRSHYNPKTRRTITNYPESKDYDCFLFRIYVNTCSLYDSHEKCGLEKLDNENVFFYDNLNSTFYIEDSGIENFLEELNEWYVKASIKSKKIETNKTIDRLKSQILSSEEKLKKLDDE